MSQANAAAIKRRGVRSIPIAPPPPQLPRTASMQPQPTSGLTLQQVIQITDSRLVSLENFMKTSANRLPNPDHRTEIDELNGIISEYNDRFNFFATEINNIKNTLSEYDIEIKSNKSLLIQLQSFISHMDSEQTEEDSDENDGAHALIQ